MPLSRAARLPPTVAPKEEPKDLDLELMREEARGAVERSGLREIARQIGMSHTGLRDFIATPNPRTPYGAIRWRLKRWAVLRGVALSDTDLTPPTVQRADASPKAVPATIPPRAYKLIYDYTQILAAAGVPDEAIDEARRLMSGQTFNTLRAHMIDDRDEEGWVKDVKAAWALIKSELRRQGFDL